MPGPLPSACSLILPALQLIYADTSLLYNKIIYRLSISGIFVSYVLRTFRLVLNRRVVHIVIYYVCCSVLDGHLSQNSAHNDLLIMTYTVISVCCASSERPLPQVQEEQKWSLYVLTPFSDWLQPEAWAAKRSNSLAEHLTK